MFLSEKKVKVCGGETSNPSRQVCCVVLEGVCQVWGSMCVCVCPLTTVPQPYERKQQLLAHLREVLLLLNKQNRLELEKKTLIMLYGEPRDVAAL